MAKKKKQTWKQWSGQQWARGDRKGYPEGDEGVTYPRISYQKRTVEVKTRSSLGPFAGARGANGFLFNMHKREVNKFPGIPLWIQDITADFALSGNTAQSMFKRDFYPHNFVQPSFRFQGQTFNQAQHGHMMEFIRQGHLDAILEEGAAKNGRWNTDGLMRIVVPRAGWNKRETQSQRGRRDHLDMTGYIQQARRNHKRFETATEWEFNFVVVKMNAGPFKGDVIKTKKLTEIEDWRQFLKDGSFVKNPDKNKNTGNRDTVIDTADDILDAVGDVVDDVFDALDGPFVNINF